jgi:outer membrane protein assembly factor BamD (BamD/ComL family)
MTIKILALILFGFFNGPGDCKNMTEVRAKYGNIETEKELNDFIRLLDSFECIHTGPYEASATMQKAQYALAPWTKYNYFKKGKKMLEDFILEYPDDVEARYVRFLVQSHAPFFLGYNGELEEDASVIRNNIDQKDLSDSYKQQILNHLVILEKK